MRGFSDIYQTGSFRCEMHQIFPSKNNAKIVLTFSEELKDTHSTAWVAKALFYMGGPGSFHGWTRKYPGVRFNLIPYTIHLSEIENILLSTPLIQHNFLIVQLFVGISFGHFIEKQSLLF